MSDAVSTPEAIDSIMARMLSRSKLENASQQGEKPLFETPTIIARLRKKFGLGDQPAKRMALYQQLQNLEAVHGSIVLDVISEAVAESLGADKPDRYFCRAVKMKLQARGLGRGSSTSTDW